MNTFTGYIEYGKGRGLIYFLVVSLLLSLIFGLSVNYRLQNAAKEETVTNFIERMPTFTIQNGQVVEPKDSFIVVPFEQGGQDGFILDTTRTPMDQLMFANGVYVTTDKVYFKSAESIQELALNKVGDMTVSSETLSSLLVRIVTLAATFYTLFLFAVLWAGYGILYLLVKLFFLILGRTTCPFIRGRSVFVAWSAILILDFILFALGYGFSVATAFALALILAIFIVFRTPLHSMDVEESLQALGNASSGDSMDFLDRELAKKPSAKTNSFAMEKTLAKMADEEASQRTKTTVQKSSKTTKKSAQKVALNPTAKALKDTSKPTAKTSAKKAQTVTRSSLKKTTPSKKKAVKK